MPCTFLFGEDFDSDQEAIDSDFEDETEKITKRSLSDIGKAAYDALAEYHWPQHRECWNLTHGKVIGEIAQSPPRRYWSEKVIQPLDTHSDDFPERMYNVMIKAEKYLDFTSLSPPDGKFLKMIQRGLAEIARRANARGGDPVICRFLFGNIVGMPVDCDKLIQQFIDENEDLPDDANIYLYISGWRKGVTWNHSKIIAVDGKYLFTGGHNLWDDHYLKKDPVHDVSYEAEGAVAIEGHCFVNVMWKYVEQTDKFLWISNKFPDWMPLPTLFLPGRVTVASWPEDGHFPPPYLRPLTEPHPMAGSVPMIACGRYGALHLRPHTANPSDSAIVGMLEGAQTIIRMSLQDFGPLVVPNTKKAIPSGKWPKTYLKAIGDAIYERGVDVEIVLSNANACPGDLNPMTANYGNGWNCVDVACQILHAIRDSQKEDGVEVDDTILWRMVKANLRICCLRTNDNGGKWEDGKTIGNHAKFFIVDDKCYYIGSQNLYICDLAEWGNIIDDKAQTERAMEEYWRPLWKSSYHDSDCNVEEVMSSLDIDRDAFEWQDMTEEQMVAMVRAKRAQQKVDVASEAHNYDEEEENRLHR